jgi:hypothetical protein
VALTTASRLRRYQRVRRQLIADRGGEPTQAQQILADNASALAIRLEDEVAAMLDGHEVDMGALNTTVNTLRRLLETLGIERQARDITSLSQYLSQHAGKIVNGDARPS